MACFVVSAVEAAAVKAVEKHEEKKEARGEVRADRIPMSRKLKWLSRMLCGGAVLLAFEHVWHGEVVPWFPFLTAMSDPEATAEMLHEMATVGVGMALMVTGAWAVMCKVADALLQRPVTESL